MFLLLDNISVAVLEKKTHKNHGGKVERDHYPTISSCVGASVFFEKFCILLIISLVKSDISRAEEGPTAVSNK
jgi:hypothetical protein